MLRTFVLKFVCLLPRLNVSFLSIALWERKLSVVITLGIICLAHWTLLYRTMFIVTAEWEPAYQACVVTQTNPSLLNTTFFFSTFPLFFSTLGLY
jgi:hypothetical protein